MAHPLSDTYLFKPFKLGDVTLGHRIVHLPTTRYRATPEHVPTDLMKQYYTDRARSGGLLITEAAMISLTLGIYANVPGIWNETQVAAWRQIVDSVHEAGGAIAMQIWALGRVGKPDLLKAHGLELRAPSAIYHSDEAERVAVEVGNPIRELTEEQIRDIIYVQFANSARLAVESGVDFVAWTDKYGGGIEGRARFVLELIDHLCTVIDPRKLAVRLSPFNDFQVPYVNPTAEEDYTYIVKELQKRADDGKALAFLDISDKSHNPDGTTSAPTTAFVRKYWKGVLVEGGSFTYDKINHWRAIQETVGQDDKALVGFCRYYTSNPDLPERLRDGYELTDYDRSTFYTHYNYGYNTFPVHGQEIDTDPEEKVVGMALAS
ncbi:putative NADPH dehydrogenase [Candida viswanathii]|uniref:Putative NADPH dehydrogenase n=1 Tax=Candida viswanathii TaxID=5486 RepID=A0A367YD66_9ASCO|nr:putative NADPH dehydrogenase [Candida viswanathii]